MSKDEFYESIIDALKKPLDPGEFELCACDLLRKDFPGIAPIYGGKDAGMDGAIPDAEGEPFPLVCTTSKEVRKNLTSNLRSYAKKIGARRKVVLATSTILTPVRIQNLYDAARNLGFTLIQVVEGRGLALRLYERPEWCRRLLSLTGNPSSLSILPRIHRPFIGNKAIGRSDVIDSLRIISSDRILCGQPGAGKTFLLHLLAQSGWGLFAVSGERTELANEIRSKSPGVIIVDDAHVYAQLLEMLINLRQELDASYHLVASCWPGAVEKVASILNVGDQQILTLSQLNRDQMVEVINQTGLQGPVNLVRELVTQSLGKPGLAVTLTDFILRGGKGAIGKVLAGDIVARQMKNFFLPIMGRAVNEILASFAVGGRSGMKSESVSGFLSIPPYELRHKLTDLNLAGIIQETRAGQISVIPRALRYSLVKEVFFSSPAPLQVTSILSQAASPEDTLDVLVGARAYGGSVSIELLQALVQEIDTPTAWKLYAGLGPEQSVEALEKRPQYLTNIAKTALFLNPEDSIPFLLDASGSDDSDLHAKPEHPLRQLKDWIMEAIPGQGISMRRREAVLKAVAKWVAKTGNIKISIHALSFIFNPCSEWFETDPGAGLTVSIYSGILPKHKLVHLRKLWIEAKFLLQKLKIDGWTYLFQMLDSLMHPHVIRARVPNEIHKECKSLAIIIIKDLVELSGEEIGVCARLRDEAKSIGYTLNVQVDKTYDILYPTREAGDNWDAFRIKQEQVIQMLNNEWMARPRNDVAEEIVMLEKASERAGGTGWPRWSAFLCGLLAAKTNEPDSWAELLIYRDAPADFVQPFLEKSSEDCSIDNVALIDQCLQSVPYQGIAVDLILRKSGPSGILLDKIWEILGHYSGILEALIIRRQISLEIIKLLLGHNDLGVVKSVVDAVWGMDNHAIPEALYGNWKKAVLRIGPEYYALPEILLADPALTFEWLKAHLDTDLNLFRHDEAFDRIIGKLDKSQKLDLLDSMKDTSSNYRSSNVICSLIGRDVELYKSLLSKKELSEYHLAPLGHCSEDVLPQMVQEAIGLYNIDRIADAIFPYVWSWHGKASDFWKSRLEFYMRWKEHPDELIRRIADILVNRVTSYYQSSKEHEQHEAVFGIDRDD